MPKCVDQKSTQISVAGKYREEGQKLEFHPTYEEAVAAIPPGRYRHFKGKEYEVIGIARHSETEEPVVVYRALYGDYGVWVRPASMWNETVERGGQTYKRFCRLDRIERVEKFEPGEKGKTP